MKCVWKHEDWWKVPQSPPLSKDDCPAPPWQETAVGVCGWGWGRRLHLKCPCHNHTPPRKWGDSPLWELTTQEKSPRGSAHGGSSKQSGWSPQVDRPCPCRQLCISALTPPPADAQMSKESLEYERQRQQEKGSGRDRMKSTEVRLSKKTCDVHPPA